MLFRSILLPTLLIPTAGASLALLALHALGAVRSADGDPADRLKGAAATALAFLSGFVAMTGWPRWPPVEATQRLFFVVALALTLAWFADPRRGIALTLLVRVAFTGGLLGWILQSQLEHRWDTDEGVLWVGGCFVVGLLLQQAWGASLRHEGEARDVWAGLTRLVLLCGMAATLGMSGSARLAQLTGALACGVGVVEVGSRVLGRRPWHGAAAPLLASAVLGLLTIGHFYAELSLWTALLLALAFLLLGVPTGDRPWMRTIAWVPLVLAVALAAQAMLNRPEDPYADYYTSNSTRSGCTDAHGASGTTDQRSEAPVEPRDG